MEYDEVKRGRGEKLFKDKKARTHFCLMISPFHFLLSFSKELLP